MAKLIDRLHQLEVSLGLGSESVAWVRVRVRELTLTPTKSALAKTQGPSAILTVYPNQHYEDYSSFSS